MSEPVQPLQAEAQTEAGDAFFELARTRRSIRVYAERLVPRALTARLIDCATRAPSNFNRQPWQFVVADEPSWCKAIYELLERGVARVGSSDKADELFHLLDHVRTWLYPLRSSPVIVLAFYKPSPERLDQMLSSANEAAGDVTHYNPNLITLGMAIQNLLLAAHAEGLSACMHSGPLPFLRGVVNRLLHLPPNLQLAGVISIGYPAEQPQVPPHRELEKVLRFLEGPVPEAWLATPTRKE
ncbi:nitroreductase family protein [Archangium lansingense]|uniref:Nitroreductase family protein n=1 Tax=Archangium lansingense TaxID=2995310 RepID=A0ABT4ALF7_9BACT|nr:nitroreductase family protein [Archangium lansinium]MCY1082523.1 nitroreductase family protein [Archangium lansinium]